MNGKDLEKALLWEAPHIGEKAPEQIPEAQNFCEGYKTFLNEGKTERECVKKAVSLLTNAGYKEFDPKASYKPGDKIYWVNRKKAIIASTIGTKDLNEGLRMNGAHIDSPRLDLKPNPLFEKDDRLLKAALLRRNPQISVGHRAVIHARRCYEGGRRDC